MKKYLIIGDGESPHIQKWVKELSKHFEVYLLSSRNIIPDIKNILPAERIFTLDLSASSSKSSLKYLRMLLPLRKIIKKIKPEYVNAHYISSHGLAAALVKKFSSQKFQLIQTVWGTDILVTPFKNSFYHFLTSFSLKQAKLVTTDSKRAAELVPGFCNIPVITFPFGLEKLPDISPGEKDPHLYFSNRTLNANSNIDRVLEFFAKIHDQEPEARLVISHDGPNRNELEELCTKLGLDDSVTFTGFNTMEQQNLHYRKAMFYFSILTSDALSVSLLEAMAFGCIPIVSDLPDNTDWVKNGENGLVLSEKSVPDDLKKLRTEQKWIFKHNREMIGKRAIFPDAIKQFVRSLINME